MNIEDYKKHIENEEAERRAKPFYIRIPLNIKDFFQYRIFNWIKEAPYEMKWWIQGHIRGYSDQDTWNLNSYILKKVYKPLKIFVKNYEEGGFSLPAKFAEDPAAWLWILKKIEFAIEQKWKDENDFLEYNKYLKKLTDAEREEHQKNIEEGLELFGKYFMYLWD